MAPRGPGPAGRARLDPRSGEVSGHLAGHGPTARPAGDLPARKRPTAQGHVWLVELPDEAADRAGGAEMQRLRAEVRHWRELAMALSQELVARRREVQELLALLDRILPAPEPDRSRAPGESEGSVGGSPRHLIG